MSEDGDLMGINHSSSGRQTFPWLWLKLLTRNSRSNSGLILTLLNLELLLSCSRIWTNLSVLQGGTHIHVSLTNRFWIKDSKLFHTLCQFKFLFMHCIIECRFTKYIINALSSVPLQNFPVRCWQRLIFAGFSQLSLNNPGLYLNNPILGSVLASKISYGYQTK